MTYVVTEACIQCKYTDCVTVCPMDCFFEGPNFLVIHPDECIDCSICVAECPVGAIVSDQDVTPDQQVYVELNRTLSENPAWKRITQQKAPLPNHEHWAAQTDKLALLQKD
ncbi:ferredoxin FdxA [Alcaligenes faecalis]|uniref:Ferredoxin n=1 Tax=Alcaligenes faecalis TaxID=511 RepID=A0A2U2BNQ6_ALCFA|nr:ferredoxin FdxA [Alcaligenes faecalis]PWE15653.1 4Fe-4S ferredoxin [Alcaligenes faecalis]